MICYQSDFTGAAGAAPPATNGPLATSINGTAPTLDGAGNLACLLPPGNGKYSGYRVPIGTAFGDGATVTVGAKLDTAPSLDNDFLEVDIGGASGSTTGATRLQVKFDKLSVIASCGPTSATVNLNAVGALAPFQAAGYAGTLTIHRTGLTVSVTLKPGGSTTTYPLISQALIPSDLTWGTGTYVEVDCARTAGNDASTTSAPMLVGNLAFDDGGANPPAGSVPLAQAAPTVGTATATAQPLTWPAATNGTAPYTYDVQVALAPTVGTQPPESSWTTALGGVAVLATTTSGLASGTRYGFRIVAHDAAGAAVTSTPVYGVTAAAPAPTPVPLAAGTVTVGTPTSTSLPLSYTQASGGTAPYTYDLDYGAGAAPSAWTRVAGGVAFAALPASIPGLTPGTLYSVRVTEHDAAGGTAVDAVVQATTAAAPAPTPTPTPLAQSPAVIGVATATAQPLTWPAATGGTAPYTYDVQTAPAPIVGTRPPESDWSTALTGVAALGGTVSGRAAGTRYGYRIVARDAAGASFTSSPGYGVTAAAPAPTPAPAALVQLVATPRAADGTAITDRVVRFRSTNPKVATVAADGTITRRGLGRCLIVASVSRRDGRVRTKQCAVTVVP